MLIYYRFEGVCSSNSKGEYDRWLKEERRPVNKKVSGMVVGKWCSVVGSFFFKEELTLAERESEIK
jgi:hypothetical protein